MGILDTNTDTEYDSLLSEDSQKMLSKNILKKAVEKALDLNNSLGMLNDSCW